MKKALSKIIILAVIAMSFISCVSTSLMPNGLPYFEKGVELPENNNEAIKKILQKAEQKNYLYKFKAVNASDAECIVMILDEQYMSVIYPQTNSVFLYYYHFVGDYLEYHIRKGIFGYAVNLENGNVEEIVFTNRFFGSYNFKSINDQISNDKRYAQGYITWNLIPETQFSNKKYDVWHFLEFFTNRDKELRSSTDEAGNKRDLAGTVYYCLTEQPGYYGYNPKAESKTEQIN